MVYRRVVLMAFAAQALPAVWMLTLQYEQGISPVTFLRTLCGSSTARAKPLMHILEQGSSFFTFVTICTINAVLCALALLMEKVVFTRLRATELRLSFQSSVSFVILRAMAIHSGVTLQVPGDTSWHWLLWAIVCGWAAALQAMSHARLTYLLTSPCADGVAVTKVLGVVALAWGAALLALLWSLTGPLRSAQWYLLWCFDFIMLTVKSANTFLVWLLYRMSLSDTMAGHVVEEQRYHAALVMDLLLLFLRFALCANILAINEFSIGPINIVAFFQCKSIVQKAKAKLNSYNQYLSAVRKLEQTFGVKSVEQLSPAARAGGCLICRDPFGQEACILPCGHLFHKMCISRWLQRQPSCPTCRLKLDTEASTPRQDVGVGNPHVRGARRRSVLAVLAGMLHAVMGMRLLTILANILRGPRAAPHGQAELPAATRLETDGPSPSSHHRLDTALQDEVARVLTVFPDAPRSAVAADISATRSAHLTSNNILEGRVYRAAAHAQHGLDPGAVGGGQAVVEVGRLEGQSECDELERARPGPLIRQQVSSNGAAEVSSVRFGRGAAKRGILSAAQSSSSLLRPSEMHAVLAQRKAEMFTQARRLYVRKHGLQAGHVFGTNDNESDKNGNGHDHDSRSSRSRGPGGSR